MVKNRTLFNSKGFLQTEQKSLPNDTIRYSLGKSFIPVAGCTFNLHFSTLLPEDILFPFGGLDFHFLANSEGFGDFSLSNRV